MVLTRKQAWRRVRIVRHEAGAGDTTAGGTSSTLAKKPRAGDWMRQVTQRPQQQQQQQQQQCPEPDSMQPQSTTAGARQDRSDSGTSDTSSSSGCGSPHHERNALDNWRLPQEGRNPSARPGASAARRQAGAACVRVGSRVSFNTVVAAILIPSAKDLHAAARQELWWQETDYRDFRINFIQFMRTPPDAAADAPEMVPVEIVAESKSTPEQEQATAADDEGDDVDVQHPVVVDQAVAYDDAARAAGKVRAWPVEEDEEDEEEAIVSVNTAGEQALSAAAAAAGAATAAVVVSVASANPEKSATSLSDVDTSPPTPPTEQVSPTGSDGDESDESVETGAVLGVSCAGGSPQAPLPSSTMVSPGLPENFDEESAEVTPAEVAGAMVNSVRRWSDQAGRPHVVSGQSSEDKKRGGCRLGWSSVDDGNDADEELDTGGNTMRSRRCFSNLETVRRDNAGLASAAIADDVSDCDENSDDADSSSSSGSVSSGSVSSGRRPRALSLDGWFTCGLENGLGTKSYETHDHAGRLRDLVKLAPLPAICATPPLVKSTANREVDLNEALRRLGVTFNVSANSDAASNRKSFDMRGRIKNGETKSLAKSSDADQGGTTSCPSPSPSEATVPVPNLERARELGP